MYFNGRKAGHDTIGVTNPSQNWYLAEGYTGGNFDEWILIQNPGDTDAATTLYLRAPGREPGDPGVQHHPPIPARPSTWTRYWKTHRSAPR